MRILTTLNEESNKDFPQIDNYYLYQRIFYKIAIYVNFIKNELVIVKANSDAQEQVEHELKILKLCEKSPYIINIIGEICVKETKQRFIILPYCKEGDLKTYLNKHSELHISQIKSIAGNLFDAVKFLKSVSIIHRDIKCENILINSSAFFFDVKLIDFENAVAYNPLSEPSERCGTFGYIAPEMFDENFYSFGVDIWSIGVVLYYLFTRQFPFGDRNKHSEYVRNSKDFRFNYKHQTLRKHFQFRELLENIFVSQYKNRWSAEKCLQSNWLHLDPLDVLNKLM